jgi:predicted AAA+ superfamily ATPase
VSAGALLSAEPVGPPALRDGPLLAALFESLVTLSARVYAQATRARVSHLRTRNGDHQVDLIVERRDGRVLAIEVKLAAVPSDRDVRHLRWLAERIGSDLLDAVVVTTGPYAYRRPDGIAIVPAALLGP